MNSLGETFSVKKFSEAIKQEIIGRGTFGEYHDVGESIVNHLQELGTRTVVIEEQYIDRDYIIDYSKFYSRSFRAPDRYSRRMHFFKSKFTKKEFLNTLETGHEVEKFSHSYLGFVVVKPIEWSNIGRTVLLPSLDQNKIFLNVTNEASLFGIPLHVRSVPYQTQDKAVSACATIALWTTLNPLHHLFGVPLFSPSEITEIASSLPGEYRKFPTTGLSLQQVINFINYVGLEVENINALLPNKESLDLIPVAIKAYLNAGIPVIAILKILLEGVYDDNLHAVVVVGYEQGPKSNMIDKIYTHDDQLGPFNEVSLSTEGTGFIGWEDGWKRFHNAKEVKLERLLIPLYPKIRLSFGRIYHRYLKVKNDVSMQNVELLLYFINKYKEFILRRQGKNKLEILTKSLPRFVWVIRVWDSESKDSLKFDILFDATDVFPREPIGYLQYE